MSKSLQNVAGGAGNSAPPPGLNQVVLRGRLAAPAEVRELPSGDLVAVWRVVVPRSAQVKSAGSKRQGQSASAAGIDTIDCSTFSGRLLRVCPKWAEGSWLEVQGELRRRFWRSPGGPRSRYEVEASRVTVISKPSRDRATVTSVKAGSGDA